MAVEETEGVFSYDLECLWDILEQEVDRELLYIAEDIEELVIEDGNVYYDTLEFRQEILSTPRFLPDC